MSKITLNYLVLHCTGTAEGLHVSKEDIIHMHTDPVNHGGQGRARPGFSEIIYLNGDLVNLIPFESEDFIDQWGIGNGVNGLNGNALHIAYAGGMDAENKMPKDTRTIEQNKTLELFIKFTIKRHPKVSILGYNEAPNTQGNHSPCFAAAEWLHSIGVSKENTYNAHEMLEG